MGPLPESGVGAALYLRGDCQNSLAAVSTYSSWLQPTYIGKAIHNCHMLQHFGCSQLLLILMSPLTEGWGVGVGRLWGEGWLWRGPLLDSRVRAALYPTAGLGWRRGGGGGGGRPSLLGPLPDSWVRAGRACLTLC